jgi:signal transduction histidine kinase
MYKKIRFEYRIVIAYLIIGGLWILLSDKLVNSLDLDNSLETRIEILKGWGYVIITALLFFFFLKKHLNKLRNTEKELEKHKTELQEKVDVKIKELDETVNLLKETNEKLSDKNKIINLQNIELKDAFDNLRDTQNQLIQAEKKASVGVFTAGLAHEINNPLNFILGGVTGLENFYNEEIAKDEKLKLFISSIKTGVDRASFIVSGLNQITSRIGGNFKDYNINDLIDKSLKSISLEYLKRIKIIKNYSSGKLLIECDENSIIQVLMNIILNACQSIKNEGEIVISTFEDDGLAQIQIRDTGCGISPENIAKVTDPFFTTKNPGEGTGLGLSIALNNIKEHYGNLSFVSEIDKGTTVYIQFPLKRLL